MENSLTVLIQGKNGTYLVVTPNFDKMQFDQTHEVVRADTMTPLGFPFSHEHRELFHDSKNHAHTSDEVKQSAFRALCEKLQKKAQESGAHYVLIDDLFSHNGSCDLWSTGITQCQFFVTIAHKYVEPPVFKV